MPQRFNEYPIVSPHFRDQKVSRPKNMVVSRPKNMVVSQPKMVQWPILNNSHAYPFCKTMPGNGAIANTK